MHFLKSLTTWQLYGIANILKVSSRCLAVPFINAVLGQAVGQFNIGTSSSSSVLLLEETHPTKIGVYGYSRHRVNSISELMGNSNIAYL